MCAKDFITALNLRILNDILIWIQFTINNKKNDIKFFVKKLSLSKSTQDEPNTFQISGRVFDQIFSTWIGFSDGIL